MGAINLVEYNPLWPEQFLQEAARIRAALGELALQVEHTGSTSVPGLAAKPVIDILLVVSDSADETAYVPQLAQAGYTFHLREPEWHEHRLLKGRDPDTNIHVFSPACPEIERLLIFRNRLRQNEADRHLYLETKRELATRDWNNVDEYAAEKTPVIEEILTRAFRDR